VRNKKNPLGGGSNESSLSGNSNSYSNSNDHCPATAGVAQNRSRGCRTGTPRQPRTSTVPQTTTRTHSPQHDTTRHDTAASNHHLHSNLHCTHATSHPLFWNTSCHRKPIPGSAAKRPGARPPAPERSSSAQQSTRSSCHPRRCVVDIDAVPVEQQTQRYSACVPWSLFLCEWLSCFRDCFRHSARRCSSVLLCRLLFHAHTHKR